MIGKITGIIDYISQTDLIIDVKGVGYIVSVPAKTFVSLKKNDKISLFIHTQVREDDISLFGFKTTDELSLFKKLISVSGIGTKTALAIMSASNVDEITKAVVNADVEFFSSIPGIGKKTAQRAIIDLKTKLGDTQELDLSEKHLPALSETLQALKQFGFDAKEARKAIHSIKNAKTMTTEELLKESLRVLG